MPGTVFSWQGPPLRDAWPALALRFYGSHGDRYDQLVMFTNFSQAMGRTFAFNQPIQGTVSGIHYPLFGVDISSFFGSSVTRGSGSSK